MGSPLKSQYLEDALSQTGFYPLSLAVLQLKKNRLSISALRKYCQNGKIGLKLGKMWLLTKKEIEAIDNYPPDTFKAGRPKKIKKVYPRGIPRLP